MSLDCVVAAFCVDEPFRESGCFKDDFFLFAFFRNLQQQQKSHGADGDGKKKIKNSFRLAQFECILHVTHSDFIVARREKNLFFREEVTKTKPERRIISEAPPPKTTRSDEGENMKKFHFMNVVYRICADSAFHGVRDRLFWQKIKQTKKTFLLHSPLILHTVSFSFDGV